MRHRLAHASAQGQDSAFLAPALPTNFLAHLWLADRTQTSLAGSVLGDVVRGSELSAYPDDIAHGIRLHRRVDAATDRHPLVVQARERFDPAHRRYAGIVLDLAADHALAARWEQESSQESLRDFTHRCGRAIAQAAPWFLLGGGRAPTAEGFTELLRSYASEAGIDRAIARTAQRLREPSRLIEAGRGWEALSLALQTDLPILLHALEGRMREKA